ncbi:MAG: TonB-dependent receptor [Acidobacteria bacterium]|nr:TonB-dependent receptor [Acidobacteriota bacterium]
MRLRTFAALIVALLLASPLAAQEQTGRIEGVVKDSTGAVLPGVKVEIRSSTSGNLAGTVVSAESGAYRFIGLLPGTYEITATLTGFTAGKFSNIDLRLGQVLTIDPVLKVAGQTETIQVTAESPLIDIKQSAKGFSISAEQLARLPRGRDFTTLVTQAPGANFENRQNGITIDGAAAAENRFIVDGVETTNPENGLQGKRLITDFVSELQVKSSGYAAEFGGAVGGVINVVTKTGTNQYRGDFGFYYTDDFTNGTASTNPRRALRLTPTDTTVDEYVTFPADEYKQWDPGFSVGGPILRDRLWFFGGYQPTWSTQTRTANLSDSTTVTKENDFKRHHATANLSGLLTNSTKFKLAYNQSSSTDKGVLPGQSLSNERGSSSPFTVFDTDTVSPNWALSGNIDFVASNNFFIGARGGYYLQDQYTNGIPVGPNFIYQTSNIGLADVPTQFQNVTGFRTFGTNFAIGENKYGRVNATVDATYYANFGGQHTFKGGIQADRLANSVDEGETGNRVLLFWNRSFQSQRGPFGYYRVRSNAVDIKRGFITQGEISNTNVGLFIQDAWTINDRLTLNLGIRGETESVPNYTTAQGSSDVAVEWGFKDKLAPRVGFAWDVTGNGKNKLYGNWGVFYDTFKLELPRGSFGGDKWLEYWFTLERPDYANLISNPNCPPACDGKLILGPVDFRHPSNSPEDNLLDPDIDPYRLQEASIGFDRELSSRMSVGVRYIHKQVDKAIEDVGTLDDDQNEIYYIGNPGYGVTAQQVSPQGLLIAVPKAKRDYDGVEFLFDKRLANRWSLRVSYLWSRLWGNYSGLTQSDEAAGYGFRSSPNVGRNFDNILMTYGQDGKPVYGRLGTDRPHQVKTQFAYDVPIGTTVGVNYRIGSGVPVTREAAAIEGNNFPIQYRGRLSDGRTDPLSQADLFLQHEFKLGGGSRIQLTATVNNLFDQETEINRFFRELSASSGAAVNFNDADFFAGRVNFDQEIARLGDPRIVRDPRFLKSDAFQGAREIRFGVKFLF